MPLILGFIITFFSPGLSLSETYKIVVLGDSIAAGYGVAKENAYPQLLENKLKKKNYSVKVVNAGISGSTTASAFSRLKWQLRSPFNILILELGGNDGLRGIDTEVSKQNLAKTIELAKKNKIKILLAGMKLPRNYGEDYRMKFEKLFKDLARQYQVELMPFLLKDVGAVKNLNLADGIHPNEKGHAKIADNLTPFVEKLLK